MYNEKVNELLNTIREEAKGLQEKRRKKEKEEYQKKLEEDRLKAIEEKQSFIKMINDAEKDLNYHIMKAMITSYIYQFRSFCDMNGSSSYSDFCTYIDNNKDSEKVTMFVDNTQYISDKITLLCPKDYFDFRVDEVETKKTVDEDQEEEEEIIVEPQEPSINNILADFFDGLTSKFTDYAVECLDDKTFSNYTFYLKKEGIYYDLRIASFNEELFRELGIEDIKYEDEDIRFKTSLKKLDDFITMIHEEDINENIIDEESLIALKKYLTDEINKYEMIFGYKKRLVKSIELISLNILKDLGEQYLTSQKELANTQYTIKLNCFPTEKIGKLINEKEAKELEAYIDFFGNDVFYIECKGDKITTYLPINKTYFNLILEDLHLDLGEGQFFLLGNIVSNTIVLTTDTDSFEYLMMNYEDDEDELVQEDDGYEEDEEIEKPKSRRRRV